MPGRELPIFGELASERFGRVLPSLQAPLRVARDERERVDGRARHDLGDERGELAGERPQAALLPAGDERAGRPFVGDGGTGRREGEPPPLALAAAGDRPDGGCATPRAQSAVETVQRVAAVTTDEVLPAPARGAATREDEIEEA